MRRRLTRMEKIVLKAFLSLGKLRRSFALLPVRNATQAYRPGKAHQVMEYRQNAMAIASAAATQEQ
jgi:hypothetical protein